MSLNIFICLIAFWGSSFVNYLLISCLCVVQVAAFLFLKKKKKKVLCKEWSLVPQHHHHGLERQNLGL